VLIAGNAHGWAALRNQWIQRMVSWHPASDSRTHSLSTPLQFKGVEMDVLYAGLAQFLIPDSLDLSHNSVLRGCDEQSVRSLNGCRVTDTILR